MNYRHFKKALDVPIINLSIDHIPVSFSFIFNVIAQLFLMAATLMNIPPVLPLLNENELT